MSKLYTLNELQDETILNNLFNNEITILEDVQGSKIYVNWNGKISPSNQNHSISEPINKIDLAMQITIIILLISLIH
jgi:hypothetical protein